MRPKPQGLRPVAAPWSIEGSGSQGRWSVSEHRLSLIPVHRHILYRLSVP